MEQPQHSRLRKQVATVLGVGEATVERVVADWKQRNDRNLPHQTIGRPKLELNPNITKLIRNLDNTSSLYELVKNAKTKVPFACVEIARKYGHNLHYTPP